MHKDEITQHFPDDQKSKEVQEILKGMPTWISRRGIIAIVSIAVLLIAGGLYIRYPETYRTSFRVAALSLPKDNPDTIIELAVDVPLSQVVKERQLIIVFTEDKKKSITGRITKISESGSHSLIYFRADDRKSVNILKQVADQKANVSGRIDIIIRYRNFFNVLFRQ